MVHGQVKVLGENYYLDDEEDFRILKCDRLWITQVIFLRFLISGLKFFSFFAFMTSSMVIVSHAIAQSTTILTPRRMICIMTHFDYL